MLMRYFSPSRAQQFLSRPNGLVLEGFAKYLDQSGYAKSRTCEYLKAAEHFVYWADQTGAPISIWNNETLENFVEHLGQCQCDGLAHLRMSSVLRGARIFLAYHLYGTHHIHPVSRPVNQESEMFSAFCQWMRQHRGSSEKTLCRYSYPLRYFLEEIENDPERISAQNLRQFILEHSQKKGLKETKICTQALRMFIRFLIAEGKCAAALVHAIPKLASWRLSTLPRFLQADEVERLITSCDPRGPTGLRNRAILLLLARLGLRAGDVIRLRIGDIDWGNAWISVSGKNRRHTKLPLTEEVGQAIVDYLQLERPRTDTDTLFVRSCAPFRPFAESSAISIVVRQAMRQAGVVGPCQGAHVLRHSVATSMLRQGASLQEIATVLRHRSIETTRIYAKVDVAALLQIAQSWPEGLLC